MIKNVGMKDCNFSVNEEKRTVVCWLNGTKNFFLDFLCENDSNGWLYLVSRVESINKFEMNNKFTGTAVCAGEDEWNEELGKRMAFYRMKRKLFDSFYNKLRAYFDMKEDELDRFEQICLAYKAKVDSSMMRQENIIIAMGEENGNEED